MEGLTELQEKGIQIYMEMMQKNLGQLIDFVRYRGLRHETVR